MACCAARLGARSTFLGKVGQDAFGDGFRELLRRENVSTDAVLCSDRLPTAVGFIICSSRGSNIIVIDVGANGDFTPADVLSHREVIEASDVILSPLEIPLETALAAAAVAQAKGVRAILNPAPAQDLRGVDLRAFCALTPNETEARVCLGLDPGEPAEPEDLARALLSLGVRNVVITLGAKGALWVSRHGARHFPALEVAVVDTVGAGDAFNAGLAAGLSEDVPFQEAICLGIAAASLSTEKRETIDSYPCRAEVDARIHEIRDRLVGC
jgi:ribokinase